MISGKPTISETTFDVIIIGAGINGAGIARDAAMRGLNVLLLDKGDIGGGTSAWSTRLIHGGLRYLEHGEFGLVRESLRERERLMKIAPHLVRPLRMLIPVYSDARRGLWTMRAGMAAYDLLSFDKTLPRHQMLSRTEALQEVAGLNPDGLVGAAVYYDAQVEFAERLVLENALAAVEYGAQVETYARVWRFAMRTDRALGVEFISELTGSKQLAYARLVVNASGPWVDRVLEGGTPVREGRKRLIGGTKGSHLIVGNFRGAPSTAIYVEAETDSRPFFIIPWNNNYLIGTTDMSYEGTPDTVEISEEEIDYLLRETNRVIPSAGLNRSSILYTYSGVRPLPFTGDHDEQSITRRHFIRQHRDLDNLISIVGGKLTTYRSLAEETVDLVCAKLGRTPAPCTTAQVPLPGGKTTDFAAFSASFNSTERKLAEHLLRIYGGAAARVMELVAEDIRLAEVIDQETGTIAAEVVHAFRNELAQTLSDCLLRRTMLGLNSTRGLNAVEAAAGVAHTHLGWSDEQRASEIDTYRAYVSRSSVQQL